MEDMTGGSWNKRPHTEGGMEKPFAMKILVSNKDAGTVIGRGGATISTMQSKSGSRIRVSNSNDYFPGTQDRVVLVTGEVDQVVSGSKLVLEEVYKNAESIQNNPDAVVSDNIFLKLLVPNGAAGIVIGKGGENIRKMVEESGSKIQLSPKEQQVPGIEERILTVQGNVEQIVKATGLVVAKVCEDPNIRYANITTNYSRNGAFGMAGPRGGPPGPPVYAQMPGYGAPYGAPPPGYGADPFAAYQQPPAAYPPYGQVPGYEAYQQPYGAPVQAYGAAPGYDAYGQTQAYGAYGQAPAVPGTVMPGGDPSGNVAYTLYVADHVVPAILGRAGAVIKEFMDQSGATIKVSQKGEYAPGTTNRVVTITGTQSAASYAHQLVSAKIPTS